MKKKIYIVNFDILNEIQSKNDINWMLKTISLWNL